MAGTGAERRPAQLRGEPARHWPAPHEAPPHEAAEHESAQRKLLYAVDARLTRSSPVSDVADLTALCTAAVKAASGHVLDASHVIFPNGAVTLVLILAESHLSVHTWPEEHLIAIDLFSCGAINGEAVIAGLASRLHLDQVSVRRLGRGLA